MSPDCPDFNWVRARHKCFLHFEFEVLQRHIKESTEERVRLLAGDNSIRLSFHKDKGMCSVLREPGAGPVGLTDSVTFYLKDDHILVGGATHRAPLKLTLTLNDDGECRFRVNGDGEFQHWQVVRRSLESLLFDSQIQG